jgi:copper(I)-binding protein
VNRALRAATMSVLLLSPLALSACSAGQVTQTASQNRDKVGDSVRVGAITVRAVELEYPRGDQYDAGDDAPLRMAIVNSSNESDTLTDVEGKGFGSAEITGAVPEDSSSTSSDAPTEIEIPADSSVFVGEDDVEVTLTDLDESMTTGQRLELVLTFENAGEVTVLATVANPDDEESRGESFDFHEQTTSREGGENGAG